MRLYPRRRILSSASFKEASVSYFCTVTSSPSPKNKRIQSVPGSDSLFRHTAKIHSSTFGTRRFKPTRASTSRLIFALLGKPIAGRRDRGSLLRTDARLYSVLPENSNDFCVRYSSSSVDEGIESTVRVESKRHPLSSWCQGRNMFRLQLVQQVFPHLSARCARTQGVNTIRPNSSVHCVPNPILLLFLANERQTGSAKLELVTALY